MMHRINVIFKDEQCKESVCELLDEKKMGYSVKNGHEISFASDDKELSQYMRQFEQVLGDPEGLMDLDAIWNINTPKEVRLSGE